MRKTKEITIAEDNRDKGKTFILTEMSAIKTERWLLQATGALGNNFTKIISSLQGQGLTISRLLPMMLSSAEFSKLEPLLDTLMECVKIKESQALRSLTEDDIQELSTVFTLRMELVSLHFGFFQAVDQ